MDSTPSSDFSAAQSYSSINVTRSENCVIFLIFSISSSVNTKFILGRGCIDIHFRISEVG